MRPALRLVVLSFTLAACERDAPDLREWRPSDHDHTDNPAPAQVDVSDAGARGGMLHGIDEVVLVAWRQNCTTCHGIIGRGDGPQAAMTRPRNLSDPQWQGRVTDADIAETIRRGRGAMPAFDLPEATVTGLVKLVRLFDESRQARASDAAAAPSDGGDAAAPAHRARDAAPPRQGSR
jgi:cytochrome c oxidase cbb3-type subunit 3